MAFANAITIILCSLLCSSTTAVTLDAPTTDDLPAHPLVDILIVDYFKMERTLWQRIEHRADNVLLQVYKNHEMFFDRIIDQSGSGVVARNLVPNIDVLITITSSVNNTSEMGRTHLKEQSLDRDSITDYANFALKILKDASNLFDFSMKDPFWESILTVCRSKCCALYEIHFTKIVYYVQHFKDCRNNTSTVQSPHQVVYDFYRDIQSGFLKSYVTAQMSYMILGYYNNGNNSSFLHCTKESLCSIMICGTRMISPIAENYSEQVDILRSTFQQRFERIRQIAKKYLKKADKAVWKCDTKANNGNFVQLPQCSHTIFQINSLSKWTTSIKHIAYTFYSLQLLCRSV